MSKKIVMSSKIKQKILFSRTIVDSTWINNCLNFFFIISYFLLNVHIFNTRISFHHFSSKTFMLGQIMLQDLSPVCSLFEYHHDQLSNSILRGNWKARIVLKGNERQNYGKVASEYGEFKLLLRDFRIDFLSYISIRGKFVC